MNIIESVVTTPPPAEAVRRVTIELSAGRASALRVYLNKHAEWYTTPVENELKTLHTALGGWNGDFVQEVS